MKDHTISPPKKRILILQNVIFEYRKPLYNQLSKYFNITVLHSGKASLGKDDLYQEIITPVTLFGKFCLQKNVIKHARNAAYDVVIAMFDLYWLNNILGFFIGRDIPFIWWGHRYSGNTFADKGRDLLMKPAVAIILYSYAEKERMARAGIDLSKVFVAQNTIHVSNHEDCSQLDKDSFLFVGRTQKSKKIDVIIRAFSEIIDQIPKNIKINIVGSGPEDHYLMALAQDLKVADRVLFHGAIVDDEILKPFFCRAYAYVSPGPVGLGAIHSLAYGIPVVTRFEGKHGPEFRDLQNGTNALIYGRYDELKNIMIHLCNNRELSARLGRNAYVLYSKGRTLDKMVEGFKDAILYAINRDRGRR